MQNAECNRRNERGGDAQACRRERSSIRMLQFAVCILPLISALSCGDLASAAEIRLRPQVVARGAVVTLGDVAEIYGADPRQAETLAGLDLFPAPAAAQKRFVTVRELQDLLLVRGVNLPQHRLSGAAQVVVASSADPAQRDLRGAPSAEQNRRASRLVHEALLKYLRQAANARDGWELDFEVNDEQAKALLRGTPTLRISGGAAPWTGTQRFQVAFAGGDAPGEFALEVRITRPPMVPVATRALPRGAVIRAEDIQLASAVLPADSGDVVRSADELIGRETTRAVSEGRPIDRGAVRSPIMIRRGDVVTVYARASGIRVRSVARAKEDASLGDLVPLESLHDRKAFFARACGVQEAEMYSRAVQSEAAAAGMSGVGTGK